MKLCAAILLICVAALSTFARARDEDADALTSEQSAGIQKNFFASKYALKEYCRQTNPAKAAIFEEAWANYLKIESPEMLAYSVTTEFTAAAGEVLKEFTQEARRNGAALDGLTKSCQLALDLKKF